MNETSYRAAVIGFKRQLIETTLRDHGGNRTHAARALGLPRTYLLRLIRGLDVAHTHAVQATTSAAESR